LLRYPALGHGVPSRHGPVGSVSAAPPSVNIRNRSCRRWNEPYTHLLCNATQCRQFWPQFWPIHPNCSKTHLRNQVLQTFSPLRCGAFLFTRQSSPGSVWLLVRRFISAIFRVRSARPPLGLFFFLLPTKTLFPFDTPVASPVGIPNPPFGREAVSALDWFVSPRAGSAGGSPSRNSC